MTIDKQTSLQDFFNSVDKGEISREDILPSALCYSEFKNYFDNNPNILLSFWGETPENQKIIIDKVLTEVRSQIRPKRTEKLHQLDPDRIFPQVASPKEVVENARFAGKTIQEQHTERVNHKISKKVNDFVVQLNEINREAARRAFLEPINTSDPNTAKDEILTKFEKSGIQNAEVEKAKKFVEDEHIHKVITAEFDRAQKISEVVFKNIDTPNVFAKSFLNKVAAVDEITEESVKGAERFAWISTFVETPKNIEGFALSAFISGAKATEPFEKAVDYFSFLQAWGEAKDELIKKAATSEGYAKLLQSGNALVGALSAEHMLHGAENLVEEIFKAPPGQDALDYLEDLRITGKITMSVNQLQEFLDARELIKKIYPQSVSLKQDMLSFLEAHNNAGRTTLTSVDMRHVLVIGVFADHHDAFHFELNPSPVVGTSPLNWILRFGEKEAAGAAGLVAKKATVSAFLTKFFSWLGTDAIAALSGPIAWVWWAAANILPWVMNAITSIVAPVGTFLGAAWEGLRGTFGLPKPNPGPLDVMNNPNTIIGGILIVAIGLPLYMASSRFSGSMGQFIAKNEPSGSGYTGPIQYTGPAASGDLQCLNYTVTPKIFNEGTADEVDAGPLAADQGPIINNAVSKTPQLGLYNCLLNCPQNKINIYGDGASVWWGYTADANDVVIYPGYFSSSDVHLQARLIAHELGHVLAADHPEIFTAFTNGTTTSPRASCGCLGTYPSRTSHPGQACDPRETPDETFAEAAAMFLTGKISKVSVPRRIIL